MKPRNRRYVSAWPSRRLGAGRSRVGHPNGRCLTARTAALQSSPRRPALAAACALRGTGVPPFSRFQGTSGLWVTHDPLAVGSSPTRPSSVFETWHSFGCQALSTNPPGFLQFVPTRRSVIDLLRSVPVNFTGAQPWISIVNPFIKNLVAPFKLSCEFPFPVDFFATDELSCGAVPGCKK